MVCPWIEAAVQKPGYFWKMLIYSKKAEPRSAALLFCYSEEKWQDVLKALLFGCAAQFKFT